MLGRIDGIVEHNDVTTMDLPVRNDRVAHTSTAVTELVHQEVIADQEGISIDSEGI